MAPLGNIRITSVFFSSSRTSGVRCQGLFWFISSRSSKFVRFVLLRTTMADVVPDELSGLSFYAYRAPADVFTDTERHFGPKLVDAVCAVLECQALFHDCLPTPDELKSRAVQEDDRAKPPSYR